MGAGWRSAASQGHGSPLSSHAGCFRKPPPSFGPPGSVWFLRTKRRAVCVTGPDTHGKVIAGSADRRQHTPALKLQEDGAILHGAEGIF